MRTLLLVLFLFCLTFSSKSQTPEKQIKQETQMWTQYSMLGKITDRWAIYLDFVDRFNGFFKSENTIFFRPAIVYHLSDNTGFYAGYAYVNEFKTESVRISVPEQRHWQQLLVNHKYKKISIQHRYRLEERFERDHTDEHLKSGHTFTWRFRYKLGVLYPIWTIEEDKKILSVHINDELFTSFGKNVSLSYFNQNRLFLGIAYQFNPSTSVVVGYTDIFESTSKENEYNHIKSPTININQKIDFRKDKKATLDNHTL